MVNALLEIEVNAPAQLAVQIGVARSVGLRVDETLQVSREGSPVPWEELGAPHDGRLWIIDASAGPIRIEYRATVSGRATPQEPEVLEEQVYRRPSRYCQSDSLGGFASRTFRGVEGPAAQLAAVSSWVGTQLDYVSGSSDPTDGAVDTLLASRGVCRDFAHLTIALLRALEIPARLAAVYAPGLAPMDFHAVVEACVDRAWYVLDPTSLAPRQSLVRIATGRDATDTSFVSSYGGNVILSTLRVGATVSGALPIDDPHQLVQLS